jgi:hypothetical protein
MSNALLTSSIIEREVWMIASQYLPGRDIATIRHDVRVVTQRNAAHGFDEFEVLIEWGAQRRSVSVPTADFGSSLDDFSERHLAPLVQELAAAHFPAPANEDR